MFELIEDRSLLVPITETVTGDQRRAAYDLFGRFGKSMRQIADIVGFRFVKTAETVIWEEMQKARRVQVNRALERGKLLAMPNLPDPGGIGKRVPYMAMTSAYSKLRKAA